MIIATIIVAIFAALAAGAPNIDHGLFQALIAYRFLCGIGIGAEYPAVSLSHCRFSIHQPNLMLLPLKNARGPSQLLRTLKNQG